jgi:oligopeptide/dipeptide ABC transporter ATP-binding protein
MAQRIMIAMMLVTRPKLLIADEPTSALDVTIQAQILELMKALKREIHTAVLLITHDLGVMAETCDRVAVMYAGGVVEQGPVATVLKRPEHPYTQGLLRTIPNDVAPDRPLFSIRGQVPSLLQPTGGCAFAPRCDRAMPECVETMPPRYVLGPEHDVACFLHRGKETVDPQSSQNTPILPKGGTP